MRIFLVDVNDYSEHSRKKSSLPELVQIEA
jgi:hypothetical protein